MKKIQIVLMLLFSIGVVSGQEGNIMPAVIQRSTPPEAIEIWRVSESDPRALLTYLDTEALRNSLKAQWERLSDTERARKAFPNVHDQILYLQWLVVDRLGDIGGMDLIPDLERYVADREATGKLDAANTLRLTIERIRLRAQGRATYVQALIRWVEEPDPPLPPETPEQEYMNRKRRVIEGARALGVLRATEAVPALIVKHEDWKGAYGIYLARALARIGDRRAMETLRQELLNFALTPEAQLPLEPGEPDIAWAYWQMRTQGMTQEQTIQELIQSMTNESGYLKQNVRLELIGQPAIPALIAALASPPQGQNPEGAQIGAAMVLGKLRAVEAVDPLRNLMRNGPEKVRNTAAWALGQIGDRSALEDLMEAARSPNTDLQMSAIGALGELADTRAESLLLERMREATDPNIRYTAVVALRSCGTTAAIPALQERLALEPDENVRKAIEVTIRELNNR